MRKEYLLRGDSLLFEGGFKVLQPTVDSVMEIGYPTYMWFIECLCSSVSDMIVPLWGRGIDFEEVDDSELLKILIDGNEKAFCQTLQFFSNADSISISDIDGSTALFVTMGDNSNIIDGNGMEHIRKFFCNINKVKHSEMRRFPGQKTKKSILDEDWEEFQYNLKEQDISNNFANKLTDLVVMNQRDWDYVYSLTIARLNEELYKIYKDRKINLTLHGIYSGTIDGSKIPSDNLDLNKE